MRRPKWRITDTRCECQDGAIISPAVRVAHAIGLLSVEQQCTRRLSEYLTIAVVAHEDAAADEHQLIGRGVLFRAAARIRMTAPKVGDVDECTEKEWLCARRGHESAIYPARERRRKQRVPTKRQSRMRPGAMRAGRHAGATDPPATRP